MNCLGLVRRTQQWSTPYDPRCSAVVAAMFGTCVVKNFHASSTSVAKINFHSPESIG